MKRILFEYINILVLTAVTTYGDPSLAQEEIEAATQMRSQSELSTNPHSSGLDTVAQVTRTFNKQARPILERKCYDCHSEQTSYPWYYKIPGIKGMIDKDINRGREALNFTDSYPSRIPEAAMNQLEKLKTEIEERTMPPRLYTAVHLGAKLSPSERETLLIWITDSMRALAGNENCSD